VKECQKQHLKVKKKKKKKKGTKSSREDSTKISHPECWASKQSRLSSLIGPAESVNVGGGDVFHHVSNDTCFSECGTTFRMLQCRPENETQAPTEAAPSRTICTAGYQVESEPMYQIPLELRECHDRFSFNSCLLRCP
jgi:hypothetical protein